MENLTEEEVERKEQMRQKRLANLRPLKKFEDLTEEEREKQMAIVTKGGKARGEQIKKAKTLKETTLNLLECKLSKEQATLLIGDDVELLEDAPTVQGVLTIRMLQEVLQNGNTRAMEYLRDTSGQKPTHEIELSADIMTNADRELLEKVSARLGQSRIS